MSRNLKKQFPKLDILCKISNPRTRKVVLSDLSKDKCLCKAIREIVKNVVNGNIKLSSKEKDKLRKHKNLFLKVAKKRKGAKKSRQLIQQTGSGLILPILIPLVANLLSGLLKNDEH